MKDLSKFQVIVMAFFAGFIILGVFTFATFKGGSNNSEVNVTIWGVIPESVMTKFFETDTFVSQIGQYNHIHYIEKDKDTIGQDFLTSIADGSAPDLLLIPQDMILSEEKRLQPISYKTIPQRSFQDGYVDEARLLLRDNGVIGIPFVIDPLVMYWNRSLYTSSGVANPPKYWDEFYNLTKNNNLKDDSGNIKKTFVALGGYTNIKNAKEILSAMLIQSGTPIVSFSNGTYVPLIHLSKSDRDASISALRYYTDFADPAKEIYSWNRGMVNSERAFTEEKLATYFGFAGELDSIRAKNPNLNFDVTTIPQIRDSKSISTYGNLISFVIPKNATPAQVVSDISIINILTSDESLKKMTEISYLPPVKRNLLVGNPNDAYLDIFNKSALIANAWYDPSEKETDLLFKDMVESVASGKDSPESAAVSAQGQLEILIKNLISKKN